MITSTVRPMIDFFFNCYGPKCKTKSQQAKTYVWSHFLQEARCSPHPPPRWCWHHILSWGGGPWGPPCSRYHQQTPRTEATVRRLQLKETSESVFCNVRVSTYGYFLKILLRITLCTHAWMHIFGSLIWYNGKYKGKKKPLWGVVNLYAQ